jgi:hypothetical protein
MRQIFTILISATLLLSCEDTSPSGSQAANSASQCQTGTTSSCVMGRLEISGEGGPVPAGGAKVFVEGNESVQTTAAKDGTFALPLQINTTAPTLALTEDFRGKPFNLVATYDFEGQKMARRMEGLSLGGQKFLDIGKLTLKETGAIEGRVTLADGASALGVDVYVPGTSLVAKAAEDGRFVILYVPEGEYPLVYEKSGYFYQSQTGIFVVSKQVARLNSVVLQAMDTTPPTTTILSAPPAHSNQTVATFELKSSENGTKFLCRLNSGRFESCNTPVSYVRIGEGTHTFEAAAVDGSGNIDAQAARHQWSVDLTPPLVTVDSRPASVVASTSANFAFSLSESSASLQCTLDDVSISCGTSLALTNLAPGYHVLQVAAEDSAGNKSSTKSFVWQVDLVVVDTIAIQTPPALTNAASSTVAFMANKAGTFVCAFDSGPEQPCTSPQTYAGLLDGTHTLRVTAIDLSGVRDASPLDVSWIVDTQAPAVPSPQAVANNLTNDSTPELSWAASSADTFFYRLETDITPSFNSTLLRSFDGISGLSQSVVPQLVDGIWYFRVRAVDVAGNASAWSSALSFTLDTVAPDAPVPNYLPDPYNNARPQFSWSSVVEAQRYRLQVASDSTFRFLSLDIDSLGTNTYQPQADLNAGATFWRVASFDSAGNQSTFSQARLFTIDTSAPDSPIANPVSSPTKLKRPTFSWSAVAGVSKYRIQISTSTLFSSMVIDDSSLTATTFTPSVDLNDNLYFWRVASIDSAQNQSGYSAPQEFLVDTSAPPAPTLVTYPSPSNDLTPTLQWLNPGAGAVLYELHVLQGATTLVNPSELTQLEYTATSPLPTGTTTWKVRATDAAGNVGAWSSTGSFTLTSAATWRLKALRERTEIIADDYLGITRIREHADGTFFVFPATTTWLNGAPMVFQNNRWVSRNTGGGKEVRLSFPLLRPNGEALRDASFPGTGQKLTLMRSTSLQPWAQVGNSLTSSSGEDGAGFLTESSAGIFLCYRKSFEVKCAVHDGLNYSEPELITTGGLDAYVFGLEIPPGQTEPDIFLRINATNQYSWRRRAEGVWTTLAQFSWTTPAISTMWRPRGFRFTSDGRPIVATNDISKDLVWNGTQFVLTAATEPQGAVVNTGTSSTRDTGLQFFDGTTSQTFSIESDNGTILTKAQGDSLINRFSLPVGQIANIGTGKAELAPLVRITNLDVAASIGKYNSLAFKSDGTPRIAYYDNAANKLKLAEKISGNWTTSIIDSGTNVGKHSSLGLKSTGKGVIAYFDDATGDLKVATEGASSWVTEAIDTTGDVGRNASLAVGSDDFPRIAYHDETNGDLKFARFDGTQWHFEIIDSSSANMGEAISLALDATNNPHIAYHDATGQVLRYAQFDGSAWNLSTVDATVGVGSHLSLALKSNGNGMIGYYDAINGDLKFAEWSGTTWQISTLRSTGDVGQYVSIARDTKNEPHLAFYDTTNGNLVYGNRDTNWAFRTIDGDEASIDNRGLWTSVKLNPTNQSPSAAYFDAVEGGVRFVEGMVLY